MPYARRYRFRKRRRDRATLIAYSLGILLVIAVGAGGAIAAYLYAHRYEGWAMEAWTRLVTGQAPASTRLADASGNFCRLGDPGTCSADALARASCGSSALAWAGTPGGRWDEVTWRNIGASPLASGTDHAGGGDHADSDGKTPPDSQDAAPPNGNLPPEFEDVVPTAAHPPGSPNNWPGTPPASPPGAPGTSPGDPGLGGPPPPPHPITSFLPSDGAPGGGGPGTSPGFSPPEDGSLPGSLPTTPTDNQPPGQGDPVVAIAEPGSAALLIIGPAFLVWRRLRRRALRQVAETEN